MDNATLLRGAGTGSDAALAAQSGGMFYDVRCSDGTYFPGIYIPPSRALPSTSAVTPELLARQARSRLPLPAPTARRSPVGDALVNLPTWWWVDPSTSTPLSQRTEVGPIWAEVSARPVRTVWEPGDGSPPLVCAGAGTPYDPLRAPEGQSSDCSHSYLHSSAAEPQQGLSPNDRFFAVTVTVFWQVSWTGAGGAGGSLPELSRPGSFPLRVTERQTLVTGGSG